MTAFWRVATWCCIALVVAIAALTYPPFGERIHADISNLSPDNFFEIIVIIAIFEAFSESRRRRRENLDLLHALAEERKQTAAMAAQAIQQTHACLAAIIERLDYIYRAVDPQGTTVPAVLPGYGAVRDHDSGPTVDNSRMADAMAALQAEVSRTNFRKF
jgi:hypothetical protein